MTKEQYPLNSLNIYTHDLDSAATGKGKHSRVTTCQNTRTRRIEARIDKIAGLRMPTEQEVRSIARRDGWKPGRKQMVVEAKESSLQYPGIVTCVWIEFGEEVKEHA